MKRVLTETDINDLFKSGNREISISKNDIITPLARDRIKSLGMSVRLLNADSGIQNSGNNATSFPELKNKIVIGSDHTGFEMKSKLIDFLHNKSFEVLDVGTKNTDSCDYPDFAFEVAKKIALKEAGRGMILDATGIPSAITANKIPGIRAATCYNEFSAKSAREHNDSNILVLGAKTLGEETIFSIVNVWLNTKFLGDRHQRRLDKIAEIEKTLSKGINKS